MAFIIRISRSFSDRLVSMRTNHEEALSDALAYYRKTSATPGLLPDIAFERIEILPKAKK